MKTKYTMIVSSLLSSGDPFLSSCDRDDGQYRDMTKHYNLTVKTVDSDFDAVKDNVSLYIFDVMSKFTKLVQTTLEKAMDLLIDFGSAESGAQMNVNFSINDRDYGSIEESF